MSYIKTNPIKNSTVMLMYSEKDEIQMDPPYQRMGGVWTREKKQLLIDSILNDYDIPKIYFHVFDNDKKIDTGYIYSVIDGRQRLETIWEFIDGAFPLSTDFEYQSDPSVNLAGLGYEDIAASHPKIKIKFDSFVLPIVGVETDDEDLIEDMFSRLNEAVPLNAAEKRNAIGGDLVGAIRDISEHPLFNRKVTFSNRRYQHREVSCRFLLLEDSMRSRDGLIDTKKVYLDALARKYASGHGAVVERLTASVVSVLDRMVDIFLDGDPLLRAQGNMTVYYILFRKAIELGELGVISRRRLLDFYDLLRENRRRAEEDYEESRFDLLEYDRLSQQGTNDASSIEKRFSILAHEIGLSDSTLVDVKC